jgi:predicted RNase H-like nuclease (RuvC/YqgF family)
MRRTCLLLAGSASLMLATLGCVSVKAPERINIGGGRPAPVDTSRIPPITTVEEGREELCKAYQNIEYLERENRHLKDKADEYKHERDKCRKRLEKYED